MWRSAVSRGTASTKRRYDLLREEGASAAPGLGMVEAPMGMAETSADAICGDDDDEEDLPPHR